VWACEEKKRAGESASSLGLERQPKETSEESEEQENVSCSSGKETPDTYEQKRGKLMGDRPRPVPSRREKLESHKERVPLRSNAKIV